MASRRFPYTYVSCPCSDTSRQRVVPSKRQSREVDLGDGDQDAEEKTFNPRHPRSSFSLFPPEHLLHCDECHELKCPRCIIEEIICWYCPSCLFETPSSTVRSEGNRCARNCFSCPICTSQLITSSLTDAKDGPWILNCNYCMWNTLEIGIKFDKPTNIRAQLDKIENGGAERPPSKQPEPDRKSSLSREAFSPLAKQEDTDPMEKVEPPPPSDPMSCFNALRSFYKDQLVASADASQPTSATDFAYASPPTVARMMNIYGLRKTNQKPTIMREALTASEGLSLPTPPTALNPESYSSTTSPSQRLAQNPNWLGNASSRHVSDLRPMPVLLRTKRNKRCKECKHILIRPEFKPTSVRYRIKLLALNYIPQVSLRPLNPPGRLKTLHNIDGGDVVLEPGKPSQWILTLKNPLFDPVHVSLGTPSVTPGKLGHRVTILAPQFEINANTELWDDALDGGKDGKEESRGGAQGGGGGAGGGEQIAGRIYERGRSWTSVVLEIVPASVVKVRKVGGEGEEQEEEEYEEEDEDVVEVPIRVRLEWKQDEPGVADVEKKKSERLTEDGVDEGRRELAYWMVVGVGRVGVT